MSLLSQSAKVDRAWFKQMLSRTEMIDKLKNIKLIIADVDGTLTNTLLYIDSSGEGGREFNVQDGYITAKAINAGITISLMSGKDNPSTFKRAEKLGIPKEHCAVGLTSKPESVTHLQQKLGLSSEQTLIIGDDYLDAEIKIKQSANIFACPANAIFYIQQLADIIIPRNGGDGAFRLLIDLILYVQDKHFAKTLINNALI